MTNFAHIADIHLGYAQYGLDQREKDILASFVNVVDRIIERDVDFVILAGDLFHSKDVDADTLDAAESQLSRLVEAGIEVIAVEGNHDTALYKKGLSWMEYLHKKGLLTLLAASFDGGDIFRPPSIDSREVPGYVDYEGIRIFGVQYMGQRLAERVPEIVEAIRKKNAKDKPRTTIFVGHFGVSGQIPGFPGVSKEKLEGLERNVDYIALGHLHKHFDSGFISNPGSLEVLNRRQAEWEQGMYFGEAMPEGGVLSKFEQSERRPYCSLSFDVSDTHTPDEMRSRFEEELEEKRRDFSRPPIVVLTLKGKLQFSQETLDLEWFEEKAKEVFGALHVIVSDALELGTVSPLLEDLEPEGKSISDDRGRLDRDRLETAVFKRLTGEDSRYSDEKEEVAGTVSTAKRMVLPGKTRFRWRRV